MVLLPPCAPQQALLTVPLALGRDGGEVQLAGDWGSSRLPVVGVGSERKGGQRESVSPPGLGLPTWAFLSHRLLLPSLPLLPHF